MATTTTLLTFDGADGSSPLQGVVMDSAGDLFGITISGGPENAGEVYEVVNGPTGYADTPTILLPFSPQGPVGSDVGYHEPGGLLIDGSGNLFGTTNSGGVNGGGTVFELAHTPLGYSPVPEILASFPASGPGTTQTSTLSADSNGDLFGVTSSNGNGEVFEITRTAIGYAAAPTVIASGSEINPGTSLVVDSNGDLFGTDYSPSANGMDGTTTVFEIARTAAGYANAATPLVSFFAGAPNNLTEDASGDLFVATEGDTISSSAIFLGAVFEIPKTATGYSSTPDVVAAFNGYDGAAVNGVIADAAGNLFGTCNVAGPEGGGDAFEIAKTPTGYADMPTVIADFSGSTDIPTGLLAADANGNLFDVNSNGLSNNDGGIVEITDTGFVTCFCAGTRILTAGGAVAVEDLAPGDAIVLAEPGAPTLPLRWLGRQTIATRFADPARVAPIRIRAGALAAGVPTRDLRVSPDHAMMVDGVFAQAGALVNGVSITREDRDLPAFIEYFHVELATHALILAEGAAAESFIDNVDRLAFDNWDAHAGATGAAPLVELPHPRAKSHRQVPRALAARLLARGLELDDAPITAAA